MPKYNVVVYVDGKEIINGIFEGENKDEVYYDVIDKLIDMTDGVIELKFRIGDEEFIIDDYYINIDEFINELIDSLIIKIKIEELKE